MVVQKKKSKKQSAASFRQQPSPFVFYLDRNLGKHVVADALRKANVPVQVHDDHLAADAPDEDWIALVGKKKWIAITKDKNIRYRYAEIDAVRQHGARIFVLRARDATGKDIADLLLKFHVRIQQFASVTKSPFIAGIDRSGTIKKYPI